MQWFYHVVDIAWTSKNTCFLQKCTPSYVVLNLYDLFLEIVWILNDVLVNSWGVDEWRHSSSSLKKSVEFVNKSFRSVLWIGSNDSFKRFNSKEWFVHDVIRVWNDMSASTEFYFFRVNSYNVAHSIKICRKNQF